MKTQIHIVALLLLFTSDIALGEPEVIVNLPGRNGLSFSGNAYFPQTAPGEEYHAELSRGSTFDLFVTTPGDILVVDYSLDVHNGAVFQDTTSTSPYGELLGSDNSFPPEPVLDLKPWLAADSAVTTPGATACAQINGDCPGFENVPDSVTQHVAHFDSSNDGPQTGFMFARITLIADEGATSFDAPSAEFSGYIQIANQPSPIVEEFSFTLLGAVVPEPGSLSMLGLGALSLLGMLRRKR